MHQHHNLTALLACLLICQPFISAAQPGWEKDAIIIRTVSSHTAFPEEKRMNGHTYEGKTFDVSHYMDSSVMIVAPRTLKKTDEVDLVFWFHGWYNNIDSASSYFRLAEQFIASGRKAVLVLAETSKDVPDSYGGKLEQPNMFAALTNDAITALKEKKIVSSKAKAGNIILAGHSGAYRVIAFILQNGGIPVHEVQLFDGLYGQTDKYLSWIQKDTAHKFTHWYTSQGGGTDVVSVQMMDTLKKINLPFLAIEETAVKAVDSRAHQVLFIHSDYSHNDVLFKTTNFEFLLSNSPKLTVNTRR